MVVIIEGLDGVGKTTLSKQFADKYDFEYIKESYTDDCKEKEQRIVRLLERLLSEKNYIYDRTTLIDDFVYGFLNETESTLDQYKSIILELLSKCHIFHLILDEQIREKRFEQRGDQYITKDMIGHIAGYYGIFYSDLKNVNFLEITEDTEENMKKIMEVIEKNENITHRV